MNLSANKRRNKMKALKVLFVVLGIVFGSLGVTFVLLGGLGDSSMIMGLGMASLVVGAMLAMKGTE